MKQIIYIIWIIFFCASCREGGLGTESTSGMAYRKAAWNSLSPELQQTVTHDWREAVVSECEFYADRRPAVCVTFHTTQDPLIGPVVVYLDPVSQDVLGMAPRF